MYLIDYHTHPYGHGENKFDINVFKEFIKKAEMIGLNEIGFSDHDQYINEIDWHQVLNIINDYDISIKLGLEIDYISGKEEKIKNIIGEIPFDYSIGSVHKIDNWEFDHPNYIDEYNSKDLYIVYKKYYQNLNQAVLSGLFDIIGHFDLIKVFNFIPKNKNILKLVEPVLKNIKREKLALEVNTNGLNKPVKEIYPSIKILKYAYELDIPLVLGSDAHSAKRVGENLKKVIDIIIDIGYKHLITFEKHEKKLVRLKSNK
jgi:histidinol-phosphatase (PHP family)